MYKYLFKLVSTYNNVHPFYEICSLPQSDYTKAIIFAGDFIPQPKDMGSISIYMELPCELTAKNRYANLQRLLNLISLEIIQVSQYKEEMLAEDEDFDSIFVKHSCKKPYEENISFHGLAPNPNHIARVQELARLLATLDEAHFTKLDNALNTFIWALEIDGQVNPHLKLTLHMTLLLSAIEQLTDSPQICTNKTLCSVCGRDLTHHHKDSGNRKMLEALIRGYITGSGVEDAVERVTRLHSKCRSAFLHSGELYGQERSGGYFADIENTTSLAEDKVNIVILTAKLLEQYIVRNATA